MLSPSPALGKRNRFLEEQHMKRKKKISYAKYGYIF